MKWIIRNFLKNGKNNNLLIIRKNCMIITPLKRNLNIMVFIRFVVRTIPVIMPVLGAAFSLFLNSKYGKVSFLNFIIKILPYKSKF